MVIAKFTVILRDVGEQCGQNRVYRLLRAVGLPAQVGYRRPGHRSGPSNGLAPNRLQHKFEVANPNDTWVADITHIRTYQGWLYLAVVIDLYSRKMVGWSMHSRIKKELVLNALLMAIWCRKPDSWVTVHFDQGSQYTSHGWPCFLKASNLQASVSRRRNCHDNAVAKSFFQLLKRERIKRQLYLTRDDARRDVVDYVEMFYNNRRRHGFNEMLSPVEYEKRFTEQLVSA
jgi:putative transposase